MKEILDDGFGEKEKGDFYAKLSFAAAMVTLLLLGYLMVYKTAQDECMFWHKSSLVGPYHNSVFLIVWFLFWSN